MRKLQSVWRTATLLVACVSCSSASVQSGARPAATLTPVIGNWVTVDDGGPAFRADGAQWNGATDRARLEALSNALFTPTNVGFVTHGTAPGSFPLAVARTAGEITNGTLRVSFKMIGGESDQNAGIVFGLRNNGDYYFVRYNTKDGNVAVWEYVNGERKVLEHGAVHQQLAMNTWYELEVTVRGGAVQGQVVGTNMTVAHNLSTPVRGRVGVWTKRDAVTVFRNFRVTP
jgi:hypothetical protein